MQQLESITFFNSQRFRYGHVDLAGNTIVAGTNGVGKTSTLRAALFFYGVSDNRGLGISGDQKQSFGAYFLRYANSYIFYTYRNAYGRAMVMVYRPADKLRYRFASIPDDIDLKKIVLGPDGVAYPHEDIVGEFLKHGIEMSDPVMSRDYREIIHGVYGSGRGDNPYSRFHLFRGSRDYRHLPSTLSSIFVNSTVRSSSVQEALSGCIEGDAELRLSQFRRQIEGAMDRYHRVRSFEKKQDRARKVAEALGEYSRASREAMAAAGRLLSNASTYAERIGRRKGEIEKRKKEIGEISDEFSGLKSSLEKEIDSVKERIGSLKERVESAKEARRRYGEVDIERKIEEYGRLKQYRAALEGARSRYDLLVGENLDIAKGFDREMEREKESHSALVLSIREKINLLGEEHNRAVERLDAEREEATQSAMAERREGRKRLEKLLAEAEELKEKAHEQKIVAEYSSPGRERIERLRESIAEHRLSLQRIRQDLKKLRGERSRSLEAIASLEKRKGGIVAGQEKLLSARLVTVEERIAAQRELLDVGEATLLGQIRAHKHPMESELAALVKDSVLLSDSLSPSFAPGFSEREDFFGIRIDFSGLDLSRYDRGAIMEEIRRLEKERAGIEEEVRKETAALIGEVDEEIGKKRREIVEMEEAILDLEPRGKGLEVEILQAETDLYRLEEEEEKRRKEEILTSEKRLAEARERYREAAENLRRYDRESERLEKEIAEGFRERKRRLEKEKSEAEALLEKEIEKEGRRLEERLSVLSRQKSEALRKGGVSPEDLAEAERELEVAKRDYERVDSYRGIVENYRRDKAERIDRIPFWEQQLSESMSRRDELAGEMKAREAEHRKRLSGIEAEIRGLEDELRTLALDYEELEAFRKERVFERYCSPAAGSGNLPDPGEERLADLIRALRSLDSRVQDSLSKMNIGLNDVFGAIGDSAEFFGLSRPEGSERSLIAAAVSLSDFIKSGKLEALKEQIAKGFSMTHRSISAATDDFLRSGDAVRSMVTKMNASLRDLRGIKVIESMQVRYAKSENRVLALLEKMRDAGLGAGFEATLFNPDPDVPEATARTIGMLREISEGIDRERKDSLALSDSFSLEFRVVENGSDSGWVSSLDDIGSNGTDVIVKTMIYVAMVDIVLARTQRKKTDIRVHVLLDEVGQLGQNYLGELIDFANARGIYFFNGAPDPKVPGKYDATYIIDRVNSSESRIIPAATRL